MASTKVGWACFFGLGVLYVLVTLPALGAGALPGRVTEIADAADSRTGTFEVEITVTGVDPRLRSGMVARVTISPSLTESLAFLPSQSIIDTDGLDAAVFVMNGDRVRRQSVRVVRIGVDGIGVSAPGLEGEIVVSDGAAYLRDGDRVEDRTAELPSPIN